MAYSLANIVKWIHALSTFPNWLSPMHKSWGFLSRQAGLCYVNVICVFHFLSCHVLEVALLASMVVGGR